MSDNTRKSQCKVLEFFRHLSLSPTRDQFRLITITPDGPNGSVLCNVQHLDRADKDAYGSYIALSYTWGEVDAVDPIYMQSVGTTEENFPAPFIVTQKLVDVLHHITVAREIFPGNAR
jgi:hypothetical protein